MADPELTRILSQLVKTNATTRLPNMNQVTGLSNALLSNTGVQNPYKSNEGNAEDPRGPSFVNRVLDLMSRPLYTVANPIKEGFEAGKRSLAEGDDLGEYVTSVASEAFNPENYWEGLSGKAKTTGRDILDATGLAESLPGPAKFVAGLGLDVALDPLTYVGGLGLASKLGKGIKTSAESLGVIEKGTGELAQGLASEISRRASQQANDLRYPANKVPESIPEAPSGVTEVLPKVEPPNVADDLSAGQNNLSNSGIPPQTPKITSNPSAKQNKLFEDDWDNDWVNGQPNQNPKPVFDTPFEQAQKLNKQIAEAKSPVVKNLLRKELEKVNKRVDPADVLNAARNAPSPFPEFTINQRWIDEARIAAQKFMKNNRLKDINHVGQTNLYNSIINAASKVRKDRRAFHVFQMLRAAEDELLAAGRSLTDAEGISVRLSDVANMMGGPKALNSKLVDDFRKARPSQVVEDLKSATTPQVASEVLDPVVKTAADIKPALENLPGSQAVILESEISKALTNIARAAGASSVEAKTAKAFIDDLFRVDQDYLYDKIHQEARALIRQSSEGLVDPAALSRISNAVYKSLGSNPKVLGREVTQNQVVEGIMTKFATWWGAKDLKPFSREYIDTARNVASAFSETMRPLIERTKPSQRQAAWSVATGRRAAVTAEEQQLADHLRYVAERLMGTHGITSNNQSVIHRSGVWLKELNAELPSHLKLTDAKGADALGRQFDYSKGQWMHSWKEWDVKEPAEALYQLTRALQMVTRKHAMWDDAAARWGMPLKTAEFQHTVKGIPRLAGTYFPKEIATQIENLQRQLERDIFKTPHKSIELFDKVQRMWKSGVTIYSPSHHIRNLNGDIYLAALDGVVSPRPYYLASKVMHSFPTRYKDLESVFNIMDPRMRDAALHARPGNTLITTKHGDRLTAEQIYQIAEQNGILTRAAQLEELVGGSEVMGSKFKPFGGKVHGAASRTSELRDHWVRIAHLIDVLQKSKSPLPVAIEAAVRRVKKFHPDGTDLTGFEQNVLRRIIPFYSWMRKATPLVIEGAIMRPHISLAFPKAMANMQLATGIESEGPGNPFPVDQMFPDWLKEKGIGPVLQPGSGLGRDENWRGEFPGYTIINPTNPYLDTVAQVGDPAKTLLSGLTPGARIPIELLTGQTSLGIPLDAVEGGVPGHLAQQIPPVGIGMRLTGATRDNEPWNPEQLINWLTSAGVTGTGPYQYQAQTEIRELLRRMTEEQRGDYR